MKTEITELQKKMKEEGIDIYFIPSSDFHASEYMHPFFRCIEFLSGFTGSAADMLVTAEAAYLWTDGRYFIQAEKELSGSGITLMKMGEENVPGLASFIAERAKEYKESFGGKLRLGFDGRVVKNSFTCIIQDALSDAGLEPEDMDIEWRKDLAGSIWEKRPGFKTRGIWKLPIESAGVSAADKIRKVREIMDEEGAEYLALTELTGIAWLLNLRGSDIEYTPVFYSYVLVCPDSLNIYITEAAAGSGAQEMIKESIGESENTVIRSYADIYEDVSNVKLNEDSRFMHDSSISCTLYNCIPSNEMRTCQLDVINDIKMIKNETEISCSRNAHIRDGAAVTEFIRWIKEEMASGACHSEISAADHLEERRRRQDDFIELSFPTISAYGANAAIVHYEPEEGNCEDLRPEGFLLVDSGAHYMDGTTDVTRTIALGPLTQEMIDAYTYVLKSHIRYARLRYEEGMSSKLIDDMLRKPLRDAGLDFKHGISHGVGHVLSVHEAAAIIRPGREIDAGIRAGMIMSDEPGYYKEDEFGIRTENLILFKNDEEGGIINEALTCVPYERDAINTDLLTDDEFRWINEYHAWVRKSLGPYLDPETSEFLKEQTKAL